MLRKFRVMAVTIAIAVMTLGYANPSFADKPTNGHNHGGDDGGRVETFYDVVIGMAANGETIFGGSTRPWSTFGKGKSIGLGDGSLGHTGVGEFTDLSFFTRVDGDFDEKGATCFQVPTVIHQGSVAQGRGGRAESRFFFEGFTHTEVAGEFVEINYQLQLIGDFVPDDPWPPTDNMTTTLTMTTWELSASNEGQAIKDISCIGKGTVDVNIMVTGLVPE